MGYIKVGDLKFYYNFKFLPNGYYGVTLFGNVYTRVSKEVLEKDLATKWGREMVNHERIHTLQAKTFKTKYFGFYVYYLWYWFVGLFRYGIKESKSYYNIPFEREAYDNEGNFSFKESNWKNYLK